MVDAFAAESHARFLSTNRSAFKDMLSFDKDTHRAAINQLAPSTKALVLSAQSLTMSSAGKRLKYFGEGSGRCPFCGDTSSGIINEAWSCPAFKKEQDEEDAFLSLLGPDRVCQSSWKLATQISLFSSCLGDALPQALAPTYAALLPSTTRPKPSLPSFVPPTQATLPPASPKCSKPMPQCLHSSPCHPPLVCPPSAPTPTPMAVCATLHPSSLLPLLVSYGPTGLKMIVLNRSWPMLLKLTLGIFIAVLDLRWQALCLACSSHPREQSLLEPSLLS